MTSQLRCWRFGQVCDGMRLTESGIRRLLRQQPNAAKLLCPAVMQHEALMSALPKNNSEK